MSSHEKAYCWPVNILVWEPHQGCLFWPNACFIYFYTDYLGPLCRKQKLFTGIFWLELVKIYIVNTLGILEVGHSLQYTTNANSSLKLYKLTPNVYKLKPNSLHMMRLLWQHSLWVSCILCSSFYLDLSGISVEIKDSGGRRACE